MAHGPIPDKPMSEAEAIETGMRFLVRWRGLGFHDPIEIGEADAQAVKRGDRITLPDTGQEFIAGQPRRNPDHGYPFSVEAQTR